MINAIIHAYRKIVSRSVPTSLTHTGDHDYVFTDIVLQNIVDNMFYKRWKVDSNILVDTGPTGVEVRILLVYCDGWVATMKIMGEDYKFKSSRDGALFRDFIIEHFPTREHKKNDKRSEFIKQLSVPSVVDRKNRKDMCKLDEMF